MTQAVAESVKSDEKTGSSTPAPSAVENLKALQETPSPEGSAVEALKDKVEPRELRDSAIDDVIAKFGMTGMDPYAEYDKTAQVADELDISWLDARDHILNHSGDQDRSAYGKASLAARVLQVQRGMDPKSPQFAKELLNTTQKGYYETSASEKNAWAEKIAAEEIDPLKWIRENMKSGTENPIRKFLDTKPAKKKEGTDE